MKFMQTFLPARLFSPFLPLLVYGAIENVLSKNILQNVNFFPLSIYLLHVKNIPENVTENMKK